MICQFCDMAITPNSKYLTCSFCTHSSHQLCLDMSANEFRHLIKTGWICVKCASIYTIPSIASALKSIFEKLELLSEQCNRIEISLILTDNNNNNHASSANNLSQPAATTRSSASLTHNK